MATKGDLELNWSVVKDWSETARDNLAVPKNRAMDLYSACTQCTHGILSWIKDSYRRIQSVILRLRETPAHGSLVSLDEIAVFGPNAPLLDLLGLAVQTGPDMSGTRFTNNVINGHLIEDAYIYRLTRAQQQHAADVRYAPQLMLDVRPQNRTG